MRQTENINVGRIEPLISPQQLKTEQPLTEKAAEVVVDSREVVKKILAGDDARLLVIVGPCSIHDEKSALDYAQRLSKLARGVQDRLFLLMRVYFEKPRTTVGWKGLINDPHLNDTFDISGGLRIARRILLRVAEMGLPTATEMLEPITPQYIADLITLASIGARTTESPTHRQMASGLSMPVGYKNGTDGSLQVALDAMMAARTPHAFLGIDNEGRTCVVHSQGNPWECLILRGGRSGPNYSSDSIKFAADELARHHLPSRLIVDCSHANSNKDFRRQCVVWNSVADQFVEGNPAIAGVMLESNLVEGSQKVPADIKQLQYGVSITDPCIGWEETESLILAAHAKLSATPV
ncbi:MAG TPA: 3-deoxy-7-phosphoheptulonate synthase [Pirellulales bacterium]|jgi:3-deoxy-7-phosphoheptulonate synthase|nr:3-deoxy-7-phosphoheptulonate synthase [Pirellulales bacterium]